MKPLAIFGILTGVAGAIWLATRKSDAAPGGGTLTQTGTTTPGKTVMVANAGGASIYSSPGTDNAVEVATANEGEIVGGATGKIINGFIESQSPGKARLNVYIDQRYASVIDASTLTAANEVVGYNDKKYNV